MMATRPSACADKPPAHRHKRQRISLAVIYFIESKWGRISNAGLEASTAFVGGIGCDRNTVIEPERSEVRNIQAQTKAPVVIVDTRVLAALAETECVLINHPDVIEHGETQTFNNGHAVFKRTKPV